MLASPTYKGEWFWGKRKRQKVDGKIRQVPTPEETWTKVTIPALITPEMWEEAQERLHNNKLDSSRNTQRDYLLRTMIVCECGRRWIGRHNQQINGGYYHCRATAAERWRSDCAMRFHLRQDKLEAAVTAYIKDSLLHPDNMNAEIVRQQEEQTAEVAQRDQRLRAIQAALTDTDRRLGELLTKELDGYPKAVIDTQKAALLDKRRDLETEQNRMMAERQRVEITPELTTALGELADVVHRGWERMTFAERRRILELLRLRIEVIDRDHVRVSGLISGSIVDLSY